MKKLLIIVLCLTLVFVLLSCDNENKQLKDSAETTNPPGYFSLRKDMTTDDIYSTEPYASFIPSREAISAAGFTNEKNYLFGEPEDEKPWTCLNMPWYTPTSSTSVFYITVMHTNCNYPYGANSSDNTPESLSFEHFKEVISVTAKQRRLSVQVGEYVATYSCYVDITDEELYALITSAPCFNTAE